MYGFDNFRVNSFIFIQNSNYIMVSVSGFGLVLFDMFTRQPVDLISFSDLEFDIPPTSYEIYKLMPIGSRGVRVFLEGDGSFSVYWDSIREYDKPGRKLVGLTVKDRFEAINKEISTSLIQATTSGFAQVIYYPKGSGFYEVYVRLFNYFNHDKTKNFREYKIDDVTD